MKLSLFVRSVCTLLLGGFACIPAFATDASVELLRADLKAEKYDRIVAPVDAAYQQFLKNKAGEGAIIDALYPYSQLDLADLPYLDAWVAASPDSGIAQLAHAYGYHQTGWMVRGEKPVVETPPKRIDQMLQLFDTARKSYDAAIAKLPRCNVCYAGLIHMTMIDARGRDMDQLLKDALANDRSADTPVYVYYSALQPKWGSAPGAQRTFAEQFRRLHPDNPVNKRFEAERLRDDAEVAESEGDSAGALALYDAALAVYPTAQIYFQKGALLDRLQRRDEAKAAFSAAIENWSRPSSIDDYEQRGWIYQQLSRFEEAAADWHKAFERGSVWAFESLYRQYSGGGSPDTPRISPQLDKALALVQHAIQLRMPSAYGTMGSMHYYGEGMPRDLDAAAKWYKRGSDSNDTRAKIDLAIMYWNGEGVEEDRARAIALWREAAHIGDPRAEQHLYGLRELLSWPEYFWLVTLTGWLGDLKQFMSSIANLFKPTPAAVIL